MVERPKMKETRSHRGVTNRETKHQTLKLEPFGGRQQNEAFIPPFQMDSLKPAINEGLTNRKAQNSSLFHVLLKEEINSDSKFDAITETGREKRCD